MDSIAFLLGLVIVIVIYVGIVSIISNSLKIKNGGLAFWWVFFFGLIGAIIALLMDIRDGQNIKKGDQE